ncbi:peptidylprolyl isomerase [Aliigemmobacter aestuarii]|uniref:Parvulin-like PPIase n=2 Tax=Aliigemmobacter aestuarii TaxID=1445661 RepID=A0A4S3MN65_9RHOB|nr:peptidylprolyl isomerase [Gemmobacter aestuarii]
MTGATALQRPKPKELMTRMPVTRRLLTALTAALLLSAAPVATTAQDNPFAPRIIVNDRAVTNYELEQRILFMQLLRAPGNIEEEALKALIDDRLRMQTAKGFGITASPEQIEAGMEEFAGRANLTGEQFIQAIGQAGVAPQTFRDFVEAGLVWREVVRGKFGPQANITDAEIDRAIAQAARKPEVRVLLSEIIIPAPQGGEANAMALAQQIQNSVTTEGGFAAAARSYSASASARRGGIIDWVPLTNLPPAIAPFVLALGPGEVSDPVQIPGGVALFQLRAIEEGDAPEATSVSVEYAQLYLPADSTTDARVAEITAQVDTCNDLYGVAKGVPEDQLTRETLPMSQVPADVGIALASLDPGESTTFARGANRVFLMLCNRLPETEEPLSRDAVREQLVNQRLASFADGYLEDLRANALIREP